MTEKIESLLRSMVRQVCDAEEMMVEKMLVDPQGRGIAVIETLDFNEGSWRQEMRLDSRVPWGLIYRFQGSKSYDAWCDREDAK